MSKQNFKFCSNRFLYFIEYKHILTVLGYSNIPIWATLIINEIAEKYKQFDLC